MRPSKAITNLIDACIDERRMLEHESLTVDPKRRRVLDRVAEERTKFVTELRREGRVSRGNLGTWREVWREIGRTLRLSLGGPNASDAVAACRRSCTRTRTRFDEALELSWPQPLRKLLAEQRARLDADSEALIAIQY